VLAVTHTCLVERFAPLQRASIADGKLIVSLSTPGAAGAAGAAVSGAPPAALWDYPRTPAQAIRYRVFADLHARGCVREPCCAHARGACCIFVVESTAARQPAGLSGLPGACSHAR
jgi:hypothetical protein